MEVLATVVSEAALADLCSRLRGSEAIAVDTEFIRERTYFGQLCLVQIASTELLACIDPLSLGQLDPLFELLAEPALTKVFHAARQDLEILFHASDAVPAPLFDTQVAAAMTGRGEQTGYARLVDELLGVSLPKSHTRTDWSRRPLSTRQLEYAIDDVRYLLPMYQKLYSDLDQRGRLGWLGEDCATLCDRALYDPQPEEAWQRLRGIGQLDGVRQHVARELAAWRERRAIRLDKPRQWLLRDELLLAIAQALPGSAAALGGIAGLPQGLLRRQSGTILEIVARAQSRAPDATAAPSRGLDAAERALLKRLSRHVRARAEQSGIAATLLATRRELERMLRGERELPVLQGWRRGFIGEELLALLEQES